MKAFSRFKILAALLVAAIQAPAAHADMVLGGSTDLISGSQSYTMAFVAPTSGTVTFQLSILNWPEPLEGLSVSATTASDLLRSLSLDDTTKSSDFMTFDVGGPGAFFAHVSGKARGDLQLGLYSLRVTFTPSAVPLPASAWLLATGAALMFVFVPGFRRRRQQDEVSGLAA
ncbi:MAG: hypothetical protein ABI885_10005 [Gammaproteobacteria bacterium]